MFPPRKPIYGVVTSLGKVISLGDPGFSVEPKPFGLYRQLRIVYYRPFSFPPVVLACLASPLNSEGEGILNEYVAVSNVTSTDCILTVGSPSEEEPEENEPLAAAIGIWGRV